MMTLVMRAKKPKMEKKTINKEQIQMKQFITTTHKDIADKFLSSGFCLVSHIDNVYTFLNQPKTSFRQPN